MQVHVLERAKAYRAFSSDGSLVRHHRSAVGAGHQYFSKVNNLQVWHLIYSAIEYSEKLRYFAHLFAL